MLRWPSRPPSFRACVCVRVCVCAAAPLPEAVWRTNHALHPTIMRTQEPLFNDTTFRYQLMREQFQARADAGTLVDDVEAVRIAAVLGIKGPNFFSCDPEQVRRTAVQALCLPAGRCRVRTACSSCSLCHDSLYC